MSGFSNLISSILSIFTGGKSVTQTFQCPGNAFFSRMTFVKVNNYFTVPLFQCSGALASEGIDICALGTGQCFQNDAGFSAVTVTKDSTGRVVRVDLKAVGVQEPMSVMADAYGSTPASKQVKGAISRAPLRKGAKVTQAKAGRAVTATGTVTTTAPIATSTGEVAASSMNVTVQYSGGMIYLLDINFNAPTVAPTVEGATASSVIATVENGGSGSSGTPGTATSAATAPGTTTVVTAPARSPAPSKDTNVKSVRAINPKDKRNWLITLTVVASAAALYYFDMVMMD